MSWILVLIYLHIYVKVVANRLITPKIKSKKCTSNVLLMYPKNRVSGHTTEANLLPEANLFPEANLLPEGKIFSWEENYFPGGKFFPWVKKISFQPIFFFLLGKKIATYHG